MATMAPLLPEHFGQPVRVSILGVAVDEFGIAVPGVSISVVSGELTLGTTTSNDFGEFRFPNFEIKVGFHVVLARGRGYESAQEPFTIKFAMDKNSITIFLRLEQFKRAAPPSHLAKLAGAADELAKAHVNVAKEANLTAKAKLAETGAKLVAAKANLAKAKAMLADEAKLVEAQAKLVEAQEELAEALGALAEEAKLAEAIMLAAPLEKRANLAEALELLQAGNLQEAAAIVHPQYDAFEEAKSTDEAKYVELRVFFATDRRKLLSADPRRLFGSDRSPDESISFGACEVSIPNRHRIGEMERPNIFKFEFREDPNKHIILKSCEQWEPDQFFDRVSTAANRSPNHDVFFFIHGYCVTFAEAVLRTAQIAVDLDFSGVPFCYSWPSVGSYSGYPIDEGNVEWTTPHLVNVLQRTAQLAGVSTIHLIAHSMGNRALVRCLEKVAKDSPPQIHQVVMAAPDIDAGVFLQLADTISAVPKRTTLYASSSDTPLLISKQFHGYPRAGEVGDQIIVKPPLDTVDASAVPADIFGHSYYGRSRTVLSDMYELFKNGTAPPRFGLQKASHEDKLYWIFRP